MANEIRRNEKGEKLYPFSMSKHGHDIQLAYDVQTSLCYDMINRTVDWDDKAFDRHQALSWAMTLQSDSVVWVTGKEYAFLKETVIMAGNYRYDRNYENY